MVALQPSGKLTAPVPVQFGSKPRQHPIVSLLFCIFVISPAFYIGRAYSISESNVFAHVY